MYRATLVGPFRRASAEPEAVMIEMLGNNQREGFHLRGLFGSVGWAAWAARAAGHDPDLFGYPRQLPDRTVGPLAWLVGWYLATTRPQR